MNWWIWIGLGILLGIAEVIFMPGVFVLLFFGVSAILVGFLAGTGLPLSFPLQMLSFAVLAIALIVLFRHKAQKAFGMEAGKMDVDAISGGIATASEDIAPSSVGRVEYRGSSWSALNEGAAPLKRGEECSIIRMEGLRLVVKSTRE